MLAAANRFSVTYFLAKDILSLFSVEKPGFKKLVATFDEWYDPAGRKYFFNTAIPTLYNRTKDKVVAEISKEDYSLSDHGFVVEPWNETIHKLYDPFITTEWELKVICLQTLFLPEGHTGANIAGAMLTTHESWRLDQLKQTCLTTDSGSNIISASSHLLPLCQLPIR